MLLLNGRCKHVDVIDNLTCYMIVIAKSNTVKQVTTTIGPLLKIKIGIDLPTITLKIKNRNSIDEIEHGYYSFLNLTPLLERLEKKRFYKPEIKYRVVECVIPTGSNCFLDTFDSQMVSEKIKLIKLLNH